MNSHFSYTLVTPPVELSVAGSGCNSHFLPSTCPCNNKFAVVHGVKRVCMPNGETMLATHTALIPFPQLPLASRECSVFPALQQPLLSLGQFCNAGFTATLTSETVLLTKDSTTTMAGTRDHSNGIYFIPLQGYPNSTPSPLPTPFQTNMSALTSVAHTHPQAYVFDNSTYHMITLPALVQVLHRACFSPVVDT